MTEFIDFNDWSDDKINELKKQFKFISIYDGDIYSLSYFDWIWDRYPDWVFNFSKRIIGKIDDMRKISIFSSKDFICRKEDYPTNKKFNTEMDKLSSKLSSMYMKKGNISKYGPDKTKKAKSRIMDDMTFQTLYYTIGKDLLIDVSNIKPDGTGVKIVNPDKIRGKKYKSNSLNIISNKLPQYKMALSLLGPIENYQQDIDEFIEQLEQ